ncbi:MAG: hypothetical protein PHO41_04390 [Eubacteriales bacterium]|nr:hypothetical protein [Eubacteriales bacterium]
MDNNAKEFILAKMKERADYSFMPEGKLSEIVEKLIQLDAEYMRVAGVDDGAEYDDDAAYEALFSGIAGAFPEYKMYCMRMTEDYLDCNEEYLESIGAIEWT